MANDDQDDPQPTPAPLTNAPKPDPRRNLGQRRRVMHEEWEALYSAWKNGERSPRALGIRFNVSEDTAYRYIHRGLPVRQWMSFINRLAVESQAGEEAKKIAAEKMANQIVDEFGQVRQESLKLLNVFRQVCRAQVAKMAKALENMPMTRQVIVRQMITDKNGNPHESLQTVERPIDAVEMAQVSRALSSALVVANKMESLWLGGPTDRVETIPEGDKFSDDELKYIDEHDGAMPPGCTPEKFIGKMAATFGIKLTSPEEPN